MAGLMLFDKLGVLATIAALSFVRKHRQKIREKNGVGDP